MIVIEKAILHILDFNGGEPVLSNQELGLEFSTMEFLTKHIEKTIGSQNAKTGTFYADSDFSKLLEAYLKQEKAFVEFSQEIATAIYGTLSHAEDIQTADLFICQARVEDAPQLVIFKCTNNSGYVHQVNVTEEGAIVTELMNSSGLLPNLNQRMEEFAYINLATKKLLCRRRSQCLLILMRLRKPIP